MATLGLPRLPPEGERVGGGEVATATDRQGRERPLSPAYQATVLLREDSPLLKTGLRGRSRFLVDTRTAYQWIYRWYRSTFRFRL